MKKLTVMLLAVMMMLSLIACGETSVSSAQDEQATNPSTAVSSEQEYDESNPTAVLEKITDDFTNTAGSLIQKKEETFAEVGTTYEDYQKNKGLINEWINLVITESDALFARTKENSIAYFKLIAADPDHQYSEFCEEAMDEYYDVVYDEAMGEYYDSLYDDAMEKLYDEYYDGIISDAYKDIGYDEWSKVSAECYQTWSDASSAIYQKLSDESTYIYGLGSAISSAFCWNDNYDVDAIVTEYENEKKEEDKNQSEEDVQEETSSKAEDDQNADSSSSSQIETELRPAFKEAMDSYEAFYDEYCDFMKKYQENPTDAKLLAEYSDMLIQLSEMDKEFADWEDENLTKEELAYYSEVSNRVTQKLLEIS